MIRRLRHRWAVAAALLVLAPVRVAAQAPTALSDSAFASLIDRLSEPGGYFDTDNLISNEDSYLLPLTTLRRLGTSGGVYVGVGPDQNFSYIAAVRPRAAFIVDIRRDNLLEHLLFKAIFALSRNRADYLGLLFGRALAPDATSWRTKGIDSLIVSLDRAGPDSVAAIRARVRAQVRRSGVRLSDADLQTIARFHEAFIVAGPSLRFNTHGRAPQSTYPDFRRLARETDRDGRQAGFLASEEAFHVVKGLQDRNLIVPVVGDFAGSHALAAVAAWMTAHKEPLSMLYASNVEQYLMRDGGFDAFAKSVARFPRNAASAIVRSCFNCGTWHQDAVPGYRVVQMTQLVSEFAALRASGQLRQYADLVSVGLVKP